MNCGYCGQPTDESASVTVGNDEVLLCNEKDVTCYDLVTVYGRPLADGRRWLNKPGPGQLELALFTDEGVIEPNVEAAHPPMFLSSIPKADDWYNGITDALIHGKGIVPLPEGGLEVKIDYTSAVGE